MSIYVPSTSVLTVRIFQELLLFSFHSIWRLVFLSHYTKMHLMCLSKNCVWSKFSFWENRINFRVPRYFSINSMTHLYFQLRFFNVSSLMWKAENSPEVDGILVNYSLTHAALDFLLLTRGKSVPLRIHNPGLFLLFRPKSAVRILQLRWPNETMWSTQQNWN